MNASYRLGRPRVLFRGGFALIQGKNWDVIPDGQRFLMVRSEERSPPTVAGEAALGA
jgi:hypothetical protein